MFKKLLTLAAFAAAVVGANAEESWVNILTNGDAEGEYGEVPCAIGKVFGTDPTACTIEEEADGNHVFVVHATAMDANPWDNQFWIMAPQTFEEGETFKVSFRCKATKDASVGTQAHAAPGAYLHWACIGNVEFKADEWTEVSKTYTVPSQANNMQSIAFNLNDFVDANDYYFDDIKVEINETPEVIETNEYTVWKGPKECNWGDGVELDKALFANIKAGDKLQILSSDQSYQILLGAWSGLNQPCYSADGIENLDYADGVLTVTMIEKYNGTNSYTWPDWDGEHNGEFDVFALIKESGIILHGTTVIKRVDYIPVPETTSISAIEAVDATPVYYNLQGVRVENPNNGIYIVKRGNKVAKQVIR